MNLNFILKKMGSHFFREWQKQKLFFPHSQVFLSTRRGAWILNRVGDYGYPFDIVLSSRFNSLLKKIVGQSAASRYLEKKINQRFNHEMFGLKPKHRYVPRIGVGRDGQSKV